MRIGTLSLGRVGAVGDCLISAQSEGVCPDGSDYLGTLDNGGAAIDYSTLPNYAAEATAAGVGVQSPPLAGSIPTTGARMLLPAGVTANPGGLATNIQCPAGYTATGGVCVPTTSTLIPGIPNWAFYVIGVFAVVTLVGTSGKGRR